jgi:uncharacterized protein
VKRPPIALAAWALCLAACDAAAPPPAASISANDVTGKSDRVAPTVSSAAQAGLPALTGRVVDGAGLLSPEEEGRLTRQLAELERRTTDQLVIVTVESLGGRPIEEFGLVLGRRWGIGQRGKDNGVLLIVAPNERRTRIEVGIGLEPILTNERAAEIIETDLLPEFREARFADGISAGVRAIAGTLIAHEAEPRRGRQ